MLDDQAALRLVNGLAGPIPPPRLAGLPVPAELSGPAGAAGVGALGAWLGLAASYEASITHDLRWVSGATIVLAISAIFATVLVGRSVVRSLRTTSTLALADEARTP